MKCHIAPKAGSVTRLVLALCALCSLPTLLHAQGMGGYLVLFPSVGLAPGESLRLTLFKPDGLPVRAQAQVHHSGGILVGLGDGSVRAGEFQSFDFKRGDIPLPGEAGTGRLQLRASFHLIMAEPIMGKLAVSMETVSVADGASNTILFAEKFYPASNHGWGDDIRIAGHTRDILTGIVRGQTLRVTLFNPPALYSEAGARLATVNAVNGHIRVFDAAGNVIAQSDELVIPPGEFRSFDFNREALGRPGEAGTNRQQVRIRPFFESKAKQHSRVLASVEVVNDSTGTTRVLSGDQCLVFFLGGAPSR